MRDIPILEINRGIKCHGIIYSIGLLNIAAIYRLVALMINILSTKRNLYSFVRTAAVERRHALTKLFDVADKSLFGSILANSNHVLQSYLPERSLSQYRQRTHTKELLNKITELNQRDFLIRIVCTKNAVLTDHCTCTIC